MTDPVENLPSGTKRARELEAIASPLTDRALHDACVTSTCCLPAGRLLTTGWDGYFRVWSRDDGTLIREADLGFAQVDLLALDAPDALAVFGVQRNLEVYELDTGALVESFPSRRTDAPIHSAAFHPDGDLLVTGAMDKKLDIWDLSSGTRIDSMTGHRRTISAIDVLGSESLVISAGLDGDLRSWSLTSGECQTQRWLGQSPLTTLQPLDDSGRFVIGDSAGHLVFWDAVSDALDMRISAHSKPITGISASSDGAVLTVSSDGELRVWSAADGALLAWHDAGAALHSCAFDGEHIIIAGDDGHLTQLAWSRHT